MTDETLEYKTVLTAAVALLLHALRTPALDGKFQPGFAPALAAAFAITRRPPPKRYGDILSHGVADAGRSVCECTKCGEVWVKATSLLSRGTACPACGARSSARE